MIYIVFRILVGWVVINGPWYAGTNLWFSFNSWRRLIRRRCERQCKSKTHYNDARARNFDAQLRFVRSRRRISETIEFICSSLQQYFALSQIKNQCAVIKRNVYRNNGHLENTAFATKSFFAPHEKQQHKQTHNMLIIQFEWLSGLRIAAQYRPKNHMKNVCTFYFIFFFIPRRERDYVKI